jgi:serine/threonine-protein phosphatase 2A regulatory subunit B
MQVASQDVNLVARCRRVYAHAHDYHINSISTNSDGETYISADDLRINLWNLEINNQSFNIVDVKPPNMEDLTEVITCAEFHPTHCNTLAYSSSKGSIRLIDLRQSALCDNHSKMLVIHLMPFTCNILSVCTGGSRGLLLTVGTWGCIRFSILY